MSSSSLFLCHRLPFPPNKGDKIRSYALLRYLAQLGPVHIGCFVDDKDDLQYLDTVRALAGGECLFVRLSRATKWYRAVKALLSGQPISTECFSDPKLAHWVDALVAAKPIDNLIVFGSAMAPYLLGNRLEGRRVLFDMVDVDSDKWRQYAGASRGAWRWVFERETGLLEKLEKRAASEFGTTLLVSPFEADTFRELAPESANKIFSLNNGVDLEHFVSGSYSNPFRDGELPIVMTGRMDYRPNFSGAIWFAKKVAPLVFARLANAHIYFVGSNPPQSLRAVAGLNITVTGRVKDVRPYLQHAAVVIAPLQMARGVQNKVLEAMAMGTPVVATREATRALSVDSGKELWIENKPARFADAVVSAVQGLNRSKITHNARQYVEEHHSWMQILAVFGEFLDQLRTTDSQRSGIEIATPKKNPNQVYDWCDVTAEAKS